MKRIGINGLGRIGRLVLHHFIRNPSDDVEIVAANDLNTAEDIAYLLKFDSVHGVAPFDVNFGSDFLELQKTKMKCDRIVMDRLNIKLFHEKDPSKIPWDKLGVNIVLECTGAFRKREDAAKHLSSSVSKVIISAPSDTADLMVVLGVNEDKYDPVKHNIISNASCTTNSLAPVVKVLNEEFGVKHLLVTTVHAYTSSQALVDKPIRKRRRGRAAAISLIPTTTGAAKATELVLPEMKDKMDAIAIRAPVPDGAITDIVAELVKKANPGLVNHAFKEAAEGKLKGILAYSEDDLVSSDIIGNTHSGIIDAKSTKVIDDNLVKVLVWYDNEAGYAKKLLELAEYISKK
jgi:glyceraldehyde 3-phosphate dehydrogenase/glyceraldehyde-3-phosphate dehydrogenase (NAD(P))